MFKKINHIGIVVRNVEEAIESYSKLLDLKPDQILEIPEASLRIAIFKIGEIEVELLHYGNPLLPMVKALRGDQIGINHLCYEVEDFDHEIKRLMKDEFKLIEGFPRKGVHGRIAFFIPPYSPVERIEILEVRRNVK
ncbi:MAG: VOC family protein [Thermodesulfobacteriota bacterium]